MIVDMRNNMWSRQLQNESQGLLAEILLSAQLGNNRDWWVMRDILIPTGRSTSQIDFLIITDTCVFVGELKTFHGMIVGAGDKPYWKQYLNRRENNYYNPVFQNQRHVKSLKYFLREMPFQLYFHSLIVMEGLDGAKLSIKPPYPAHTSIVSSMDALFRVTKAICEKRLMNISSEQAKYLFDYIGSNQIHGISARTEHAKYAGSVKQQAKEDVENGICPQCHAKLVLKSGKYGAFMGCSRYPQCKFTYKL